jgi:hypothetical protein
MKKLIVLLFLASFALSVNAQLVLGQTAKGVPWPSGYYNCTLNAVDTVGYATTTYAKFDLGLAHKLCFWAISFKMTPTGVGTPHVWITVQGSMDNTNFVETGATTVKYGGGTDSTFVMSDVSTGILWRYLRVKFAGVAGTANKGEKVTALAIKVSQKW